MLNNTIADSVSTRSGIGMMLTFTAAVWLGLAGATWGAEATEPSGDKAGETGPFEYIEAKIPNYLAGEEWGTTGDPIGRMQKPLEPATSVKRMVLPPGFEIKLFAAEPDIAKPIAMAWDARGRLWIAETFDYPNNLQPEGEGRDRIKICEDTDDDGRADKFTIFAEGLSIPTSMVFANGGVIVSQAPDMLYLKDTDGDDKADVRKVLFSGWGTFDTHAGPSNLRRGFDNWIWGTVGYSGFEGEVGGQRHDFGQGIFRLKPDGSKLEFLRSTDNNTWGLGFSEEGLVFGSTANNNPSVYMAIPNRYYEQVRGWSAGRLESIAPSAKFYPITDKVRQVDHHGKFTAAAGHALYTARAFPEEYWNRTAFVSGPTGHLLARFNLEETGAGFVAHQAGNMVASDDGWTSPIVAEVGPDGALWMIDWYNYIIQHNPIPPGFEKGKGNAYVTPLRDKRHGRIYRIVHEEAEPYEPIDLSGAGPERLVAALTNDNMFWRQTAQRLLVERGREDVLSELYELVRDARVDEIGLNAGAIHALWTMHGLGTLDATNEEAASVAMAALGHPSAGVRRAALQVLPRSEKSLDAVLAAGVLDDENARVRLAALLALSDMPKSQQAGEAVFAMLRKETSTGDQWIADAATSAAARHDAGFLKAALAAASDQDRDGAGSEMAADAMPNGSFEKSTDAGAPLPWSTRTYTGAAEHERVSGGRTGDFAIMISSDDGADASWSATVPVDPRTHYQLSAWIKTEGVENLGSAQGALLNVHELQSDGSRVMTRPLTGTNDWTRVETTFNTGSHDSITINCLLGGWGRSTGTAWYDDVRLVATDPDLFSNGMDRAVRIVMAHYAGRAPVESIVETVSALRGAPAEFSEAVLESLATGWPKGRTPKLTQTEREQLVALMELLPHAGRGRLLALADRWGRRDLFSGFVGGLVDHLRARLVDASLTVNQRAEAAHRLIGLSDSKETVAAVLDLITLQTDPVLAGELLDAMTVSERPGVGAALIERWDHMTPAARDAAIGVLMRRGPWTVDLLRAVEEGRIARAEVSAERWLQLAAHTDSKIAALAERVRRSPAAANRQKVIDRLMPVVGKPGDAAAGQLIYEATCMVCHRFNGRGGNIGPELTGISERPRAEILTAILAPNRSVEANYRLWVVTTEDGLTRSGRLEAETRTTLELLDLAGQKHVIQREDIQTMNASPLSIMPAGFENLGEEGLANLMEYLTQVDHD